MGEEIALENGWISDFQRLMTLTLDRVILHTVMHHSSTSNYIPNFIEIEKKNCGRTDGWTFETHFIRSTQLKTLSITTEVLQTPDVLSVDQSTAQSQTWQSEGKTDCNWSYTFLFFMSSPHDSVGKDVLCFCAVRLLHLFVPPNIYSYQDISRTAGEISKKHTGNIH